MARKRRRKKQQRKQQVQKKEQPSSGGIPKEEQEEILGRVPAQASFATPPGPASDEVEVEGDLEGPPPRLAASPQQPQHLPPAQEAEVVGRWVHPVSQGLQAGAAQVTQLCEMVDMEGDGEWRDALADLEQCLTNGYRHALYILHELAPEEIE